METLQCANAFLGELPCVEFTRLEVVSFSSLGYIYGSVLLNAGGIWTEESHRKNSTMHHSEGESSLGVRWVSYIVFVVLKCIRYILSGFQLRWPKTFCEVWCSPPTSMMWSAAQRHLDMFGGHKSQLQQKWMTVDGDSSPRCLFHPQCHGDCQASPQAAAVSMV